MPSLVHQPSTEGRWEQPPAQMAFGGLQESEEPSPVTVPSISNQPITLDMLLEHRARGLRETGHLAATTTSSQVNQPITLDMLLEHRARGLQEPAEPSPVTAPSISNQPLTLAMLLEHRARGLQDTGHLAATTTSSQVNQPITLDMLLEHCARGLQETGQPAATTPSSQVDQSAQVASSNLQEPEKPATTTISSKRPQTFMDSIRLIQARSASQVNRPVEVASGDLQEIEQPTASTTSSQVDQSEPTASTTSSQVDQSEEPQKPSPKRPQTFGDYNRKRKRVCASQLDQPAQVAFRGFQELEGPYFTPVPSIFNQRDTLDTIFAHRESGTPFDHTTMRRQDPNIPSPNGACHLLDCPRELRDMIYEYVLTGPEGLFFRSTPTKRELKNNQFPAFTSHAEAENENAMESNQMKYVCKQMYKETQGLALKFNTTFQFTYTNATWNYEVSTGFDAFIQSVSEKVRLGLREIVLHDRRSAVRGGVKRSLGAAKLSVKNLNARMEFLHKNPQVEMNWILPHSQDDANFQEHFLNMLTLEHAYMGTDFSHLVLDREYYEDMKEKGRKWRAILTRLVPINYQIWLAPTMEFNEVAIRRYFTFFNPRFPTFIAGGVDAIVARMRNWYENGLLNEFGTQAVIRRQIVTILKYERDGKKYKRTTVERDLGGEGDI